MLSASIQTSSYQSALNSAVSKAVSGAKPDMISKYQKSEQSTPDAKPQVREEHTTLSKESVSKAIDEQVSEFFSRYPNGGTDNDVAQFLESIKSSRG